MRKFGWLTLAMALASAALPATPAHALELSSLCSFWLNKQPAKLNVYLSVDENLPDLVGATIRYSAVQLDLNSDGPTRGELRAEGQRMSFNGFPELDMAFGRFLPSRFGRSALVLEQSPNTLLIYDLSSDRTFDLHIGPLDPAIAIYREADRELCVNCQSP